MTTKFTRKNVPQKLLLHLSSRRVAEVRVPMFDGNLSGQSAPATPRARVTPKHAFKAKIKASKSKAGRSPRRRIAKKTLRKRKLFVSQRKSEQLRNAFVKSLMTF